MQDFRAVQRTLKAVGADRILFGTGLHAVLRNSDPGMKGARLSAEILGGYWQRNRPSCKKTRLFFNFLDFN